MAVDTRNKRMSLIGLCSPVPAMLPDPDGTIAAVDRFMFLWLYYIALVRRFSRAQTVIDSMPMPMVQVIFTPVAESIQFEEVRYG